MESGLSLVSLTLYHFALWTLEYPGQSHTCLKRFMKINHEPQWATYRDYEACYAISHRNFDSGLLHYLHIIQIYRYWLMQVMHCAKLCRLSAYTTMELMLAPGLEKVQWQTLCLLDNVSTTILTSTGSMSTMKQASNTNHGSGLSFRVDGFVVTGVVWTQMQHKRTRL